MSDKKVKLKDFEKLKKEGLIYRSSADNLIVKNDDGSFKAFPQDIYKKKIIISDDKYIMSSEEYEAYKVLFEEK